MGTKKRLVRRKPAEEAVILITVPSEAEARKIAQALVGERLAACVNIIPGVRSIYFWQGKVCDDSEFLLVCKSRGPLLEPMMRRVKSLHSYTVPEFIALPIAAGSSDYLSWIREVTAEPRPNPG